jgi:hypothetical protein
LILAGAARRLNAINSEKIFREGIKKPGSAAPLPGMIGRN